jgi:hypothetical protein
MGSHRNGKEPRMSSSSTIRVIAAAFAATATLAIAGIAGAQAPPDTTISVSPRVALPASANSPINFPGVPSARTGKPLPKGYVVVARGVNITRGAETAFAALRMTCPKGKTWRTGGSAGDISMTILDQRASGKHSVLVLATAASSVDAGVTASGTAFALCR